MRSGACWVVRQRIDAVQTATGAGRARLIKRRAVGCGTIALSGKRRSDTDSDTRADKLGRRCFEFHLCREHLGIC
jgi:hypothetical protein